MPVMLSGMDIDELAKAVRDARLEHGWSVEEAARRAGISRITWKRLEDALSVQDTSRRKAEKALGISDDRPTVLDVARSVGEISREDLNPELAEYTDQELLDEIAGRMRLLAAQAADASGADLLSVVLDADGERRIVSHTTKSGS